MSMWSREEVLRAHETGAGENGNRPDAMAVPPPVDLPTFEIASAAFILSVAALALALYVYLEARPK